MCAHRRKEESVKEKKNERREREKMREEKEKKVIHKNSIDKSYFVIQRKTQNMECNRQYANDKISNKSN